MEGIKEKIFNCHAHIFPGKISEKAVAAIGEFYGIPMEMDGSSETLIEDGKTVGVTKYLVCSTATTAHQVEAIDNFVAEEAAKHSEFIGLGSIHPDYENIPAEIERMISLGLKGVKLHPDFQRFNIDDEAALPIYECCQGRLPVLFHIGDNRYDYSSPERLLRVVEKFPSLIAIAAHLGGYRCWEQSEKYLGHPRIYIDTCSSFMFISPEQAERIIHLHGTDRVLFGTDSPMWRHEGEMNRFNRLKLTAKEREDILWNNAAGLFLKNE